MRSHRLSAAAAVTLIAAVVLVVYVFAAYVLAAAVVWVAWRVYRRKLGWAPRVRRGRTVLELAAAGVSAWWLGRRLRPELTQRAVLVAARVREAEAKADMAAARAVDAQAVAVEARRRAERARGITSSEIAQLQMLKP